jgi:hypothetical protein
MVDYKKFFGLVKSYGLAVPVSLHLEYSLGGAENGDRKIAIPGETVLSEIKKDLQTLHNMLRKSGIDWG